MVLPLEEPRKITMWLALMSAIDLWVSCGTHVYLVNGSRTQKLVTWKRVTMKVRSHVLTKVSDRPEHKDLVIDLLQQAAGTYDAPAAWTAVGVLSNDYEWIPLQLMLVLESLKLAEFRVHNRKELGQPVSSKEGASTERPLGPGRRKHRKRAAARYRDKQRAAHFKLQEMAL
ncbi:hypothetical protein ANCDUO_01746 [Ancylostoma duodenale]|uniref:Uncharacterized protein n=1 Tax=Ancylostoma duodenale TaxID=51022 RepID=A0A0C2DY66_9BILA|nr:hypothetical protein ANCDUO_01746 [Ancylostoma duodenale]